MTDYEKFGCPFRKGDSYYYFHNSGLQPQSTLYKQTSLTADPTSFLDPNKLSADGTVSLNTYSFTQSGKQFAYGLSASGSDWITITVKSTEDESTDPTKEPDVKWVSYFW